MSVFIRTVQPGLSSKRKTHDITQVEGALVRGKLKGETRLLLDVRQDNGRLIECHYSSRDCDHLLGTVFTLKVNDWMVVKGYFTTKDRLHATEISVSLSENEVQQRQVEAARKVEAYAIEQIRERLG
jgi:hypothetical protein